MAGLSGSTKKKKLLVFDFDHSLIDENSDVYVKKLAPGGELPEEIKALYGEDGWTEYMAQIFKYLHNNGSSREDILACMTEIPLASGMKELLEFTSAAGYFDHIIISDSNSIFIDHILQMKALSSVIDKVYTNPAEFDGDGCLTIRPYHSQNWCALSTVNLCKGYILKSHLDERKKQGIEYSHVLYVGDGYNDLCPSLKLRTQDFIMPRVGYTLHSLIDKMGKKNKPVPRSELVANVVPWETGLDILKHIQRLHSSRT